MRISARPSLVFSLATVAVISACNQTNAPNQPAAEPAAPRVAEVKKVTVEAPAGQYGVDLNHADLSFAVTHLGLAPYVARFQQYDASLVLNPQDWSQSSITITLDPKSVMTSYVGDYKATHKKSAFDSWEEDLARSDRFLMADEHPQVSYQSTQVSTTADGQLKIDGEMTLRGQTHPLSMIAQVTGSTAAHRFTQQGAIGFTAQGQFKRSDFGMDFMQGPGLLGDEVTLRFSGEFHQQAE